MKNIGELFQSSIDQFIKTGIQALESERVPFISVPLVRQRVLALHPILEANPPSNLDERIEIILAGMYDLERRAELIIEAFLQGRSEYSLTGVERQAFQDLLRQLADDFEQHAGALRELIKQRKEQDGA